MQLEPMPRRRLLKFGALGVVALGSAATFMMAGREPAEYDAGEYGRLLVFNNDHAQTYLAMSQAVLPTSRVADRALHLQVLSRSDEELYFVDSKIREDFCMALDVLEYLPVLFGHFSRFSNLQLTERHAFLSSMQNTSSDTFRAVLHNSRLLPLYIYYGLESSWDAIGYDGAFSGIKPLVSKQRQYYADKVRSIKS